MAAAPAVLDAPDLAKSRCVRVGCRKRGTYFCAEIGPAEFRFCSLDCMKRMFGRWPIAGTEAIQQAQS